MSYLSSSLSSMPDAGDEGGKKKDKEEEENKPAIMFEFAKTGRSTCKASGIKIPVSTPRVGVLNFQYKSFSWYSLPHCISGIKQPKTKNGLSCKVCKNKFQSNLLIVGSGTKTAIVSPSCFASSRYAQMGSDASAFHFTNFGDIEGFGDMKVEDQIEIGRILAGEDFSTELVSRKRPAPLPVPQDVGEVKTPDSNALTKKEETNTTTKSSESSPKTKKSKKAPVQCITVQNPPITPFPLPPNPSTTYFKALSYNVAGLRGLLKKSPTALHDIVAKHKPDLLCIQEHKLQGTHVQSEFSDYMSDAGYSCTWAVSTSKKGYSGVATFTLNTSPFLPVKPTRIGYGNEIGDGEGRVITVEYDRFTVVNVYTPNSGQNLERLDWRVGTWDKEFISYIKSLETSRSLPCMFLGDLNVAHLPLDAYNFGAPHLKKQAGLTEEERNSFTSILSQGYFDAFRKIRGSAEGYYSYWSMRAGNREVNKGLRLDYFICSESMADGKVKVKDCYMDDEIRGSDHGVVACVLEIEE